CAFPDHGCVRLSIMGPGGPTRLDAARVDHVDPAEPGLEDLRDRVLRQRVATAQWRAASETVTRSARTWY
ncbi:MAG: hypothetical protein ACK5BN_06615, partial [Planctomycetota bacterium]